MSSIEIRVIPTNEIFYAENDAYGIYRCSVNPKDEQLLTDMGWKMSTYRNISFKGSCPKLDFGEEYYAKIQIDDKSNYAGSFILLGIRKEKPITIEEQRIFLDSILSPTQTNNIFEVYNKGEDIIGMIQDDTFDYMSIKGIAEKTYEKLRNKVLDNLEMSELLVFLSKYGIKFNMIGKLIKQYKNPQIVIDKIQANPYLLTEVKGVGFKKADAIAKAVGYDMTSEHRINSCIRFVIGEENSNGQSWITFKQLLNKCIDLLNINKSYIVEVLKNGSQGIINVDERYTRKEIYEAEDFISMSITKFKTQSKMLFTKKELDGLLDTYCKENVLELEKNQRKFFHDWNENNILLLVGGGGMGKSYLQRILLDLVAQKHLTTALLAPTGKASRVMTNYTGRQASTLHRKMGVFDSEEDAYGRIEEDVIIVDEASMCDVFILEKFFKAVTNHNAKILFVGDDFQLPSVGVGNFLFDTINSNCVKVSRLVKVFRQADGGILNVTTDIREGVTFLNNSASGRVQFGKDCLFHLVDKQFIKDGYLHYYKKLLNRYAPEDIVILSPTKKGVLGTVSINKEIQDIVNPKSEKKKEMTFGRDFPVLFRVGDLVMNVTNMYGVDTSTDKKVDVFNGDTGKLIDINEEEKYMLVEFEEANVKIKFEDVLTSLLHCWSTTIHKSQGSQYDVVIMVVDNSMKFQLNANLLYTGGSRAKKYLIVIGQAEAINFGSKKFANLERKSFMQELLHKFNKDYSNTELM